MNKGNLLYEGKAKRIYQTEDENIFWVEYKDDATAFNGEKKASIQGKGVLNNAITSLIFEKLTEAGVENHFIQKLSETEQLVKKVTILPLEVVVRNVVAGSLSKRTGLAEGTKLKKPLIEFYYKDDDLGDPLFTDAHIEMMEICSPKDLEILRDYGFRVNQFLQEIFDACHLNLVDFKIELGRDSEGKIILADEISPDTCRLWDKTTNEKLDKDVFRRDLGNLTDAYQEILKRLGGINA
ncbi:MAG TPA: phosphoribosylaminoimidazolesuccinocarboxamide synthase [Firmicutes bacterium]|nr:phosphoribosylaminoimidazolesuccinocarboxamide synthase [Bacillales bacterium]HJA40290.1 phosphoribosylaminoimidazolesuccinocarboxamide synthase [Bacillota bacterium]